jgi:cell wall-associated NlpC family hydrolase
VLRVRALSAVLGSLTILASATTPALATSTGGAVAGATTSTSPAPAAPKPRIHLSPITAKTPKLTYKGPVYQKTTTGEVVPYQAPAVEPPTTPVAARQTMSATGGSASAVGVAAAAAQSAPVEAPHLLVPGSLARYVNGLAAAPMSAPESVQQVIWTANEIIGLPYIYGGGHASFISPGYDCSGTVSFALHGGDLLAVPEDSSEFMIWGSHGAGRWISVFGDAEHAYMDVAGLRLDTSAADDPSNQQGPRWRPLRTGNGGYTVRHPLGL